MRHHREDHPPSTTAPLALSRRRRSLIVAAAITTAVLGPVTIASAAGTGGATAPSESAASGAANLRTLLDGLRAGHVEPTTSTTTEQATTSTTAAPTTTTAAPPPPPPAAPVPRPLTPGTGHGDPADPATWDRLAGCEAGGNWAAATGNGYYGGLQFSLGSWHAVGGSGHPHHHSREVQIEMGRRLLAAQGWSAWPACSSRLGYR
jgi:hypothetical protein